VEAEDSREGRNECQGLDVPFSQRFGKIALRLSTCTLSTSGKLLEGVLAPGVRNRPVLPFGTQSEGYWGHFAYSGYAQGAYETDRTVSMALYKP